METLTLTELKAIVAAINISLNKSSLSDFVTHGAAWCSVANQAVERIKDLEFEQEINPLPFPKD